MSFRPPSDSLTRKGGATINAIEAAVAAEKAASLGHAGHRLERALAALRATKGERPREELVDEAAELAWGFLIQRELCGLRDREQVITDFAIPPEVIARIGATGRRPA